jgi:hypothetical protein
MLLAGILVPTTVFACLNVKRTSVSLDGHTHILSDVDYELRAIMSKQKGTVTVREKFGFGPSETLSTEALAVDKILQGDVASGLALLQKLEQERPGDYSIAANIGTAYELMGDNENALKWIKEGMQRDAKSHYGTEWLHALILEAKIGAGDQPVSTLKKRLLDVPDRLKERTEISVQGQKRAAIDVRHALFHQLTERVFFVKPKDPYVADLLYSYAIVEANIGTLDAAMGLLSLARTYGFPDESLLAKLESKWQWALTMIPIKRNLTTLLIIAALGVVAVYGYRRLAELCRA